MGKNIILCSDGTGNAGGKGNGTNVWRLFQAIDVSHGTQVAFHDDGVGTQDFKLFKAIGGATGFGLGRNIRQLYASLVRVYEDGDRVYLFGFSRGAYTIRSLANLIDRFGVLDRHAFDTPDALEREVSALYDDYRRDNRRDKSKDEESDSKFCSYRDGVIAFLGVWDTVDAIGVPFDELRPIIRFFGPWKHHAYELNPSIKAACHALAIDDERKSFHPNMFDEGKRTDATEKVEQVWFPGVHSNVGGGYPKDQLAYISLVWMMKRAADPELYPGYVPLEFHEGAIRGYEEIANPHGKLYDSRSGAAAYYRVSPRSIAGLCASAGAGMPQIHSSVMVRISRRTGGYTPFNLPETYEVVDADSEPPSPLSEAGTHHLADNAVFMQRAADFTVWRRNLYKVFLIVTVVLVLVVGWQMLFYREAEIAGWLSALAGGAKSILPDFAAGAVDAIFKRPGWLVLFAGLFGLLFWARGFLKRLVQDLAGAGWRAAYLDAGIQGTTNQGSTAKAKARQDQSAKLGELRDRVGASTRAAFSWVAGQTKASQWCWFVAWLALIPAGIFLIGSQHPNSDWADACSVATPVSPGPNGTWTVTRFETANPCYRTGIQLAKGQSYYIGVWAEDWHDSSIPAGPAGFKNKDDANSRFMQFWKSHLRVKSEGYFVLMGQVIDPKEGFKDPSKSSQDVFRIGSDAQPIEVPADGELILFVNDVLCPLCPPGTYGFYANNQGTAFITVKQQPIDPKDKKSDNGS